MGSYIYLLNPKTLFCYQFFMNDFILSYSLYSLSLLLLLSLLSSSKSSYHAFSWFSFHLPCKKSCNQAVYTKELLLLANFFLVLPQLLFPNKPQSLVRMSNRLCISIWFVKKNHSWHCKWLYYLINTSFPHLSH